MMKKTVLMCLVALVALVGCKRDPVDIYKQNESGVVMVLNKFYYKMRLPNGRYLYFSGLDEDGNLENLTDVEEKIRNNAQVSFGTVFFVDNRGTMLTNRHVASPPIDRDLVKQGFAQLVRSVAAGLELRMQELEQEYRALELQRSDDSYYYDDEGNLVQEEADNTDIDYRQQQLQQAYFELEANLSNVEQLSDASQIDIKPVCQLGIAYDNSHVNSDADFLQRNPCTVVRMAGDEDVDLALLRLDNGTTPRGVHVFDIAGSRSGWLSRLLGRGNGDDDLKINSKVYMIGYNAGPVVGSTRRGIKAQFTSGNVTQQPDGQRVLYSIPTVEGSSGSPVVDENGNLVAVNFAKLAVGHAENFNFGIPLSKVKQFMRLK